MFIDRWHQKISGAPIGAKYFTCITRWQEHFAPLELALYLRPMVYKHSIPMGWVVLLANLTRKENIKFA